MYPTFEEKRKFEDDIIARAERDIEFREALRTNPKAAISRAYGRAMRWDIEVYSDTPQKMTLVLPIFEDELDDELSDDMLDDVGGGGCSIWSCIFLTF